MGEGGRRPGEGFSFDFGFYKYAAPDGAGNRCGQNQFGLMRYIASGKQTSILGKNLNLEHPANRGMTINLSGGRNTIAVLVCAAFVFVQFNFASAQSWTKTIAPEKFWFGVACSAGGNKLVAANNIGPVNSSIDFGATWTNDTTTPPSPATTVAAVYVNPTVTNTGLPLYIGSSTRGFYAGYNPSTPICFKEGSKILCLVDGKESYIPVETMRPGTLVKTVRSGYKKVEHIGHSKVYNPAHTLRSKNRLYVCTKTNYPEVTEDLVLTGCHTILVGRLSTKERADVIDITGDTYVTDGHYRLVACADERAVPYTEEGLHTIWHFALEHDDYYMNYGVYANGLLVETTSKRMMKELSGMELM